MWRQVATERRPHARTLVSLAHLLPQAENSAGEKPAALAAANEHKEVHDLLVNGLPAAAPADAPEAEGEE